MLEAHWRWSPTESRPARMVTGRCSRGNLSQNLGVAELMASIQSRYLSAFSVCAARATGLRTKLKRRAVRNRDTKHSHSLESKAQPFAAVGRAAIKPGKIAHPFQPVANCVAVSEQPLRGAGDISVGFKKCLYSLQSVSYTHLRAHETDSYLVCRL